ncbi:spore germination protein GerPE [Priestia taiwanensis]|uniref:Spore germination protein GerPE n=1 Tax=Priestia taiwanensis TaxID=1347902 RepID=A0A917EQC8_9BACI|nr:spore germination protein GerPE [Priestia taiwanensis]MBM7364217.1 spore germination protein PE [Priestia taiwanensis]GGE72617.1 hypothetical protein GCM10007140_23150 [Priestia taiwanensis]
MFKRTSLVDGVIVNSFAESSICQIGDSNEIVAYDAVFALQRRFASFNGNEGTAEHEAISQKEMPFPTYPDEVRMAVFHEKPFIHVHRVRILGVSSSSLLHVGSTNRVFLQAKIKHIREYDILPGETNKQMAELHDMFDGIVQQEKE